MKSPDQLIRTQMFFVVAVIYDHPSPSYLCLSSPFYQRKWLFCHDTTCHDRTTQCGQVAQATSQSPFVGDEADEVELPALDGETDTGEAHNTDHASSTLVMNGIHENTRTESEPRKSAHNRPKNFQPERTQ